MNDFENRQDNENGSRLIMNLGQKPSQPQYPPQTAQPQYPPQTTQPVPPVYPSQPAQPAYPSQPEQPAYQSQPVYPGQPEQPAYQSQPEQPVYQSQPEYSAYNSYGYAGKPPVPPKKKSKAWLWILLSVLGVLLVGGLIVYFCFGDSLSVKEDVKISEAVVSVSASKTIEKWAGSGKICVLEAGDTVKDIQLVLDDTTAYEAEIAYVKLLDEYDGVEYTLSDGDAFEMGKKYRVGVKFTAKKGHIFTENTVFKLKQDDVAYNSQDEVQLEFDTYAGSEEYQQVAVSPYKESSKTSYSMDGTDYNVFVTAMGKTVYDCNRIDFSYELGEVTITEDYSWDVYVRKSGGGVAYVDSFDAGAYTTKEISLELDYPMDITGIFVVCVTDASSGNWKSTLTVHDVYAVPGSN
ncbi:MAG: hypothetical protein IKJ55_05110 [Clostridia bacterium]|nr:hypothetical protein [Clostridia bacterium]